MRRPFENRDVGRVGACWAGNVSESAGMNCELLHSYGWNNGIHACFPAQGIPYIT